jgi:anti-sigma factor RsiW
MSCITDGILRARLDGELSEGERLEVETHLAACAECRRRAEAMAQQGEHVRGILARLDPASGESPADARTALARFRTEYINAEESARRRCLSGSLPGACGPSGARSRRWSPSRYW